MDALMFADVPGYAALLLRRSYADLSLPGALMDRAHEWLGPTAAKWSERDKTWTFPSGATLTFGYLEGPRDHLRYQSSEFQRIGLDELTQFEERQYRYMPSRLRRLKNFPVLPSVRSASNPGGPGHEWVYEHFVASPQMHPDRAFVPATMDENPHLDVAEYERSLELLDDTTRAQLRRGLWITDPAGKPFRREWWRGQNRYLVGEESRVVGRWISWDTALKDKDTSAYNAAVVFELLADYRLRVGDVRRERMVFPDLVPEIERTAARWDYDGKLRGVVIEDRSSGTTAHQTIMAGADDRLKSLLVPFSPTGPKEERWSHAATWCKRGCVLLPHPSEHTPWLYDFEREIFGVPDTTYKDQADAFSQGVIFLEHLVAAGFRARMAE